MAYVDILEHLRRLTLTGLTRSFQSLRQEKDIIEIKHMGREDGDISYDETDFTGIKSAHPGVDHGGSEYLKGVDIPVFLESSPEETKGTPH